jgi:hypothetical protein
MRAVWIVPLIVGIMILGTSGLSQESFAFHFGHHPLTVVTPDEQSGPVNQLQTFSVQFDQSGDVSSSQLSISCNPSIQTNFNPNIQNHVPQEFTVNSNTPGIFICEARVDGSARATGEGREQQMIGLATFIPVFNSLPPPPVMCGPGTILNDENKCIPNPDEVIMCGPGTILNDENKCIPNPDEVIMCGPGTILNDENKCVPDYANICGEGTILNDDNQCVPEPKKVDVCHKGKKTINISSNAVPAHLAHGDTLGQCS